MILIKAKDGRIGITNWNRIHVNEFKGEVTDSMCWGRKEIKWTGNKCIYKKRYYFPKDFTKIYAFSSNDFKDYPKVMEVLFKELEKEWKENNIWDGNLLKDENKEIIKEIKDKELEINNLEYELKNLRKKLK